MKRFLFCGLLFTALQLRAAQVNVSFTNSPNSVISDANPTGQSFTIETSGIEGWISNVTLSLKLSGGYNGDLYAYLTSDNGGFVVLLNRVGKTDSNPFGSEDGGMTITLSDSAASDVHTYGGLSGGTLSGAWQPDARNIDPQLVLDSDARTAYFSSFHNRNPNGTWTLFIADFASGGQTTLVEWRLNIQAVPEPSSAALGLLALGTWFFIRRRSTPN